MEHLINLKRNVITAHEFSKRGIPVILDVPLRRQGLRHMVQWGAQNKVKWYMMNFQGVNDHEWLKDIIRDRLEIVFSAGGKVILCGLGKISMMRFLMDNYKGNIAITNTTVSSRTCYYWELRDGEWRPHSKLSQKALFENNLKEYCELCGFTRLGG